MSNQLEGAMMDIKTLCMNLLNQANQLRAVIEDINNISSYMEQESSLEEPRFALIRGYCSTIDVQMTALKSQTIIVQSAIDNIAKI